MIYPDPFDFDDSSDLNYAERVLRDEELSGGFDTDDDMESNYETDDNGDDY